MVLVPVFIASLLYYCPDRAYFHSVSVLVFLLACISDGVDGFIARKLHQKTIVGSYIDPIADKLLLLSGFLCLSLMNHLPVEMRIPAWVTIPVIARDVVILIGSTIIFLTTGHLKVQPLFVGKLTTVTQMLTILASLILAPHSIRIGLFFATLFLTVASGVRYIKTGGRILQST